MYCCGQLILCHSAMKQHETRSSTGTIQALLRACWQGFRTITMCRRRGVRPAAAGPGRSAGGLRQGLAGLRADAPSRRLAARTASGRAAAHRHTQRPERASAALQAPPVRRFRRAWPQCWWAVAGPGRASSRRAEHQQHCKRRRCGGCRRVRRARAGFEIDHSERSSRVAISRAAGPDGARNNSGATSNTAQGRGPAGPRP